MSERKNKVAVAFTMLEVHMIYWHLTKYSYSVGTAEWDCVSPGVLRWGGGVTSRDYCIDLSHLYLLSDMSTSRPLMGIKLTEELRVSAGLRHGSAVSLCAHYIFSTGCTGCQSWLQISVTAAPPDGEDSLHDRKPSALFGNRYQL